jgi:uncharacterized protein YjbI with pentapeptide repeats
MTDTDLSRSNLAGAVLSETTLTGASLDDAVVVGASFRSTTSDGFTKEQLYSTASYKAKNLEGIGLSENKLWNWDFAGQNLAGADFRSADLEEANLSLANLAGANLQQAALWDADLSLADLTGASLYGADLNDANPTDAIVTGADFSQISGFEKEQLYATASYKAKDLQRIRMWTNDLSGWDFSGQDLAATDFQDTILTDVDLSGANIRNANLRARPDLNSVALDLATTYSQWTVFPDGFDPVASGLTLATVLAGDFDADDALDVFDVDVLIAKVFPAERRPLHYSWLSKPMFDLNSDADFDLEDLRVWVKDLKQTWYGDANLDGEFNSSDMVQVFAAGMYEMPGGADEFEFYNRASWAEGDWNGDLVFDSSDMVTAFADGGYEKGLRAAAVAVPEPTSVLLLVMGLVGLAIFRRRLGS